MAASGTKNIRNAKLVLLGDVGTGKSSLVLRFVKGKFVPFQTLAVNDETVKFEIWDTAGQERYRSLAPMYYRGAAAAVIVYDMTNEATFRQAKQWIEELRAQGSGRLIMACETSGSPNTIIALAGNKADLLDTREVSVEEAQAYAQENGLLFMETSAKTATNVNDIFYEIAKTLIRVQPVQNPQRVTLAEQSDQRTANSTLCCSS